MNNDKYYIIDFFNIFSDYREIIYKKENIDFHTIKHENKEKDTFDFFKLFFTKYIEKVNIKKESVFIFIFKKIHNYENILNSILLLYKEFKIHFIVIEDTYKDKFLNKNKDDFVCQYIFFMLFKKYKNCILISNDRYRDKLDYIKMFNTNINLKLIKTLNNSNTILNLESNKKIDSNNANKDNLIISNITISINQKIIELIKTKECYRCTIPKNKLSSIL